VALTTPKERTGTGPIKHELETRLIAKVDEVYRLLSSLPELIKSAYAAVSQPDAIVDLRDRMESFKGAFKEAEELQSLLGSPLSVKSEDKRNEALRAVQSALLAEGLSPLEIIEDLQIAQQTPRGRPATKRHLAVVALDMWLTNPSFSWARVTREVCNCGEQKHGRACQERLRQQVNDLRSALRRLGIEEPTSVRDSKESE
jgi:hypothetical protein